MNETADPQDNPDAMSQTSTSPPITQVRSGQPYPGPVTTSGMAVASLILGILGILTSCLGIGIILGILALVFGVMAINRVDNPTNRLSGRGMAMAGAIMGGIACCMLVVSILAGILLPALGSARKTAYRIKSNASLRAIHQTMVVNAQSNGQWYAGLKRDGSPDDLTVEGRYQQLLKSGMVTPELLINPQEDKDKLLWAGGAVTDMNYSYSLLDISEPGPRRKEWRDTNNVRAVVISDRNTELPSMPASVWTTLPGDWQGGVSFNDGRVEFLMTHVMDTQYSGVITRDDSLFESTGPMDAHMIDTGE